MLRTEKRTSILLSYPILLPFPSPSLPINAKLIGNNKIT